MKGAATQVCIHLQLDTQLKQYTIRRLTQEAIYNFTIGSLVLRGGTPCGKQYAINTGSSMQFSLVANQTTSVGCKPGSSTAEVGYNEVSALADAQSMLQ